jgi:uncharacterized protein (DUF1810 family)
MIDVSDFVAAQDDGGAYATALVELAASQKRSHWMWFVFPQLSGLGQSATSRRFAIPTLADARALLEHPVLGERLRAATDGLLAQPVDSPVAIFGELDATKLRSSMTLFHRAAPDEPRFMLVLDRFFGGGADPRTDELLAAQAQG